MDGAGGTLDIGLQDHIRRIDWTLYVKKEDGFTRVAWRPQNQVELGFAELAAEIAPKVRHDTLERLLLLFAISPVA